MDTSKVISIIAEQLGLPEADINENTVFADLEVDSFDFFQVISALEDAYEVTLDTDDTEKIKTVKDAINYISEMTAE